MILNKRAMSENFAKEILSWQYDIPYDFYNNELTDETMSEILNGTYVAIVDEDNQLVGYYCTGISSQVPAGKEYSAYIENMIDIGLGMKPNLTGKGNGESFFNWILQEIESTTRLPLRLTVATFNNRAIKLYENAGFNKLISFQANGAMFQTMMRQNSLR